MPGARLGNEASREAFPWDGFPRGARLDGRGLRWKASSSTGVWSPHKIWREGGKERGVRLWEEDRYKGNRRLSLPRQDETCTWIKVQEVKH